MLIPTGKEELIKYSTNEQYLKLKSYDKDLYEQLKGLPPKELEDKRISYKNEYIEVTKTHAVSTIINCSIWIIVSLFLLYIWEIYKNTQNNNN
ncbi:hypothetical protein N7280_05795 [Rickettsia rhipicephali]|uniref:hypothetical protein n=1 Tax=Rickettsia rhipicephali TaxID=33992 RepID=UPI0022509B1B|nr:hypothetical protein [Rickettsia rhipicephali]MCX4080090.1 hypothetical protein [Rickettsia rhipicephali]